MFHALRLYRHYAAASIRAQAQYPASLAMLTFGQFLGALTEFIAIWALFARFGRIQGWRFGEVAIFYGVVNVAFAVADAITRGFDIFGPEFVKTGAFDRLLLRPRATAFQLLGHELRLTRIGRLIQGIIVFCIGVASTPLHWDLGSAALIAWALAGGTALFSGLLVLQATLAFWTVESLEIANILTYGGVQAGEYPLGVYAAWFRDLLIFVVPIGCVAYFPVVALLGRHDPLGAPDWFLPVSPVLGLVFLAVSLWVWGFGVRRYASSGS
ncbi:MAG TPA: ABC-2 family transporter protein [Caulobacteraceae bacterium]